jgi:hypothetical protein
MGTQGPLSKSAAPFLFVALVLRALVGPAKELRARQLLHAIAPQSVKAKVAIPTRMTHGDASYLSGVSGESLIALKGNVGLRDPQQELLLPILARLVRRATFQKTSAGTVSATTRC